MDLAQSGYTDRLVVDVGMPVLHNGVRYNCRVIMLRRKIFLIRPKLHLADDGNYREGRYFSAWKRQGVYEFFTYVPMLLAELHSTHLKCSFFSCSKHCCRLPLHVAQLLGQAKCPFGDAALRFEDALLAVETCEELFTPMAPNIRLALSGEVSSREFVLSLLSASFLNSVTLLVVAFPHHSLSYSVYQKRHWLVLLGH